MIVPACTRTEGESYCHALLNGSEYSPNLYEIGGGSRSNGEAVVAAYREVVSSLLDDCVDGPSQTDKLNFDSLAAERIHAVLPLPDEISGDDAFWRYLALTESWRLVNWRHGREDDEPLATTHVGLGKKWWCLPHRLWLRAELSIDPHADDPYELMRCPQLRYHFLC